MTAAAVWAFYTRTSGLALILAIGAYLLIRKRWLNALLFSVAFIAAAAPWYVRGKSLGGNSYMKQFWLKNPYAPELGQIELSGLVERGLKNLSRYISIELPSVITGRVINPEEIGLSHWIFGLLLLTVIIVALVQLAKTMNRLPIVLYLFFSAGILLLWPEVWTGWRFILPIVPFLILALVYGADLILKRAAERVKIPWTVFALCFFALFMIPPILDLSERGKEPYPQNFQNYFDLAEWAKNNTPEQSIICCRKPELFFLFSDRKTVWYPFSLDADSVINSMRSNAVDYVVLDQLGFSSTPKYLVPAVNKNSQLFEPVMVIKNPETYLLKFKR